MSANDPLVTVIIPSYNHGQWISKAIESALNQTYKNIELIIVDDGSRDNSKEVISRYLKDSRVKAFFKDQNKGQSHSLNWALREAKGKYISWLPSDDWYLPEKTQLQVEKLENSAEKIGVVYGRGQRYFEGTHKTVDMNLPMLKGDVLDAIVKQGNFVYPVTPMFRACVFDDFHFDETYTAEGEAILFRIAGKYEYDYVSEVVAVMRAHNYNTGRSFDVMYSDNIRWWTEYFDNPTSPRRILYLRDYVIGRLHRMYGLSFITESKEYKRALQALMQAIKFRPIYIFDIKVIGGLFIALLPKAVADKLSSLKEKGGNFV